MATPTPTADGPATAGGSGLTLVPRSRRRYVQESGLALAFVASLVLFTWTATNFATENNLLNILRQAAFTGIIAMGDDARHRRRRDRHQRRLRRRADVRPARRPVPGLEPPDDGHHRHRARRGRRRRCLCRLAALQAQYPLLHRHARAFSRAARARGAHHRHQDDPDHQRDPGSTRRIAPRAAGAGGGLRGDGAAVLVHRLPDDLRAHRLRHWRQRAGGPPVGVAGRPHAHRGVRDHRAAVGGHGRPAHRSDRQRRLVGGQRPRVRGHRGRDHRRHKVSPEAPAR